MRKDKRRLRVLHELCCLGRIQKNCIVPADPIGSEVQDAMGQPAVQPKR